ncbi:MAG: cyanophycinase [Phenylobacterium sp.]|jgi:cyanophycinase
MKETTLTNNTKPMYLLADSQPLFFNQDQTPFLNRVREQFGVGQPLTAAYIGAANGDVAEFFDIFTLAMEKIGISQCKHITSTLSNSALDFIQSADIILLSGGDVWQGWQTLQKLDAILSHARTRGAVLIGISAGAIHLGKLGGFDKDRLLNNDLFATLGFVDAIFGAHDEKGNWNSLRQMVALTGGCLPGIGIASGGALIVQPDQFIEALYQPLTHITVVGERQMQLRSLWRLDLGGR